jgi:hypothetical protein
VEREIDDVYRTPQWLINEILPIVVKPWTVSSSYRILDPACGDGRVGDSAQEYARSIHSKVGLDMCDVTDQGAPCVDVGDFLETAPQPVYDLIITNPPYILAREFIEHGRKFLKDEHSKLVYLLRINFLGSQSRAPFLRDWTPSIYITPKRPSFNGGVSTDSCDYAWFVWDKNKPTLQILETEKYKGK